MLYKIAWRVCYIDKYAVKTKNPSSSVQLHLLNQVNHFVILQQHKRNEASRCVVSSVFHG